MRLQNIFIVASLSAVIFFSSSANAHVPYIEDSDFSPAMPFTVENIRQSKAMYAHLENKQDVDHYAMQVEEPTFIYLHTSIPYCAEYADFTVSYAITGPGLPAPDAKLPVTLPAGHGAIIVRDEFSSVDDRVVSYEPFSARTYWEGPDYSITVDQPGEYQMIVWQEDGSQGDYIAVIGREEIWRPADIARAAMTTPGIRNGEELHVSCNDVS
jgi:hypothetical protein